MADAVAVCGCVACYGDIVMTDAPKLLTEAEARAIYLAATSPDDFNARLRERGLIAPEPEPPVEVELAAALDKAMFQDDRNRVPYANGFRKGFERGQFTTPAASPLTPARFPVPEGQTPLDDNLRHKYLDVIREGADAFDNKAQSPYHGHSLEHCLHATGWVQRDLRVALDKAQARIIQLDRQP